MTRAMARDTAYVLEEVEFLVGMGVRADIICDALNKTPTSLVKLLYAHDRGHLSGGFAELVYAAKKNKRLKKEVALSGS